MSQVQATQATSHFEKRLPTKSSEQILKSNEVADLEDGPLFRATIKDYEGRTVDMKAYLKRILKSASATLEAKNHLLEQNRIFIETLREAPFTEPLFSHYLDSTWSKLHEQQERLSFCMQNLLIDPLQKLYDMDVKTVDTKRKHFEDCSKEYYSNLSKYLSIKSPNTNTTTNINNTNQITIPPNSNNHNINSITTSKEKRILKAEAEFLNKKSEFDLVRFDYHSFLIDLHGGKKEREILYHLLNHHEKQLAYYQAVVKTLEPHKQGLDEIAAIIAEASREQKMVNHDRDEKRKALVSKLSAEDLSKYEKRKSNTIMLSPPYLSPNSSGNYPGSAAATASPTQNNSQEVPIGLGISTEVNNKFKGIRDLEEKNPNTNIGRKKEGFLFATSKPSKSTNVAAFDRSTNNAWHKYWCVVSGGQLHEYSNWKKHLETHIEPINLRFATVREARNTDRRFCFEVITPDFKRLYQATSSEELNCWLSTINNAIGSLLNGSSSSCDLQDAKTKKTTNWINSRSLSGAFSNLTAAKAKYLKKRGNHHSSKPQATSPLMEQSIQEVAPESPSIPKSELLVELRKDLSNTICADCSAKSPDWCSLNLGILICIDCSGIHRSLGTHISKVRSLTLDSASYTPEIIQLLMSIGNSKSNNIWEAKLLESDETHPVPLKKPVPTDAREIKLQYIQSKYVDRILVKKPEENPMHLLYTAVEQDDLPLALYAIAAGAQVNDPFLTAAIPLLPNETKELPTIKLPVLDANGNEYVGRTIEVTLPNISVSPLFSKDSLLVRYALHLALISPSMIRTFDDMSMHSSESSKSEPNDSSSISSSIVIEDGPRNFSMAELLFQNGADVFIKDESTGQLLADLIGLGDLVDDEAIAYLNAKNSLRGQEPIVRTRTMQ